MRILNRLLGVPQFEILRETPGEPAGGGAPQADPPAAAPADTPPASPDLSWLPENYRPEGADPDYQGFRTAYDDAQAQLAALSDGRPEDASAYEIAPPAEMDYGEIEVPDWFEFNLDPESPMIGELQSWLHENRVPAESAPALVGMLAKFEAGRAAQFQADAANEMKALGPQGQARIDRVTRSIQTRIPNEAQRQALIGSLTTADAVRAVEALVGGATQPRSTTTAPAAVNVDGMTPFEMLREANRRAQA